MTRIKTVDGEDQYQGVDRIVIIATSVAVGGLLGAKKDVVVIGYVGEKLLREELAQMQAKVEGALGQVIMQLQGEVEDEHV